MRWEIVLLKSTCCNRSLYAAQPSAVSRLTLQRQLLACMAGQVRLMFNSALGHWWLACVLIWYVPASRRNRQERTNSGARRNLSRAAR